MNSVDVLLALCKQRKIAVSRVERDLKYGNGYFKSLKKKEIPGNRLSEVADYFGVTMDYLLGATPESYLLGTEYQLKEAEKAYGKETDPDKRDELGGLIDVLRDSLYDLRLAAAADNKSPVTEKSDGDLSDEDDELKEMIMAWKSLSPSARAHAKAVIKALESSGDSEA
ncbi:MAG: hypothetical protein IKU94_07980 [Bacteroidaceae bacterium]|nr:hypothetical protein [Bacteroidaceae bacterium]